MAIVAYSVKRIADGWGVEHDGRMEGSYLSKEAAFEATAAAASNTIRNGHGIRIDVPERMPGESNLGTEPK